VKKRALARWKGHYKTADAYRQEIDHVSETLPFYPALHIVMQDIPRSLGGGSTWSLVYQLSLCLDSTGSVSSNTSNNNDNKKERDLGGAQRDDVVASSTRSRPSRILHLAHKVLGMSIFAASQQRNKSLVFYRHERDWLVEQAVQSLQSWAKVSDAFGTQSFHDINSNSLLLHCHHEQQHDDHHGGGAYHNDEKDDARKASQLFTWEQLQVLHEISVGSNTNATTHHTMDNCTTTTMMSLSFSELELRQWMSVKADLRGRKPADAAFWFALAGVTNSSLYNLLATVCCKEVARFGKRPSCRAKDLLDMAERLAAAGIRNHTTLESLIVQCLQIKQHSNTLLSLSSSSSSLLHLHSDHCAMLIWRFSTRQRKQKAFLHTAAKHWETQQLHEQLQKITVDRGASGPSEKGDQAHATIHHDDANGPPPVERNWQKIFADPTLVGPLVIDVGCGMGVSLLGLATLDDQVGSFCWCDCNFIGVDLSSLAIGYAQALTERWGLQDKLVFLVDSAETLLENAKSYPGPVMRILIQFPTPYRLPAVVDVKIAHEALKSKSTIHITGACNDNGGNSQLPKSAHDGFMVTPKLLQQAAFLLGPYSSSRSAVASVDRKLLLQSNCEDVAVYMQKAACQHANFRVCDCNSDTFAMAQKAEPGTALTKRTQDWIAMGGERAIGEGWTRSPILPRNGRTETEIACEINGSPVHRCILEWNGMTSKHSTP